MNPSLISVPVCACFSERKKKKKKSLIIIVPNTFVVKFARSPCLITRFTDVSLQSKRVGKESGVSSSVHDLQESLHTLMWHNKMFAVSANDIFFNGRGCPTGKLSGF